MSFWSVFFLEYLWIFDDGLLGGWLWFQISMKIFFGFISAHSSPQIWHCIEIIYYIKTLVLHLHVYLHLWCKFRLVTKGIRVIEDQREPVGSLALRGLLVVLDHVACRGTEELLDLVAPRDQRYVINLSKTEWLAITLHKPRLCMVIKKKFCLSPKPLFTYKYALSMFYSMVVVEQDMAILLFC